MSSCAFPVLFTDYLSEGYFKNIL
uniref:Uncharacterized protein n=1 Tax=Anguilla anguilla TaxID=7936 RepID=A0A0E9SIE9_ANGAN